MTFRNWWIKNSWTFVILSTFIGWTTAAISFNTCMLKSRFNNKLNSYVHPDSLRKNWMHSDVVEEFYIHKDSLSKSTVKNNIIESTKVIPKHRHVYIQCSSINSVRDQNGNQINILSIDGKLGVSCFKLNVPEFANKIFFYDSENASAFRELNMNSFKGDMTLFKCSTGGEFKPGKPNCIKDNTPV